MNLHIYRYVHANRYGLYLSSYGLDDPGCKLIEVMHDDITNFTAATKVLVKAGRNRWVGRHVILYKTEPFRLGVTCDITRSSRDERVIEVNLIISTSHQEARKPL